MAQRVVDPGERQGQNDSSVRRGPFYPKAHDGCRGFSTLQVLAQVIHTYPTQAEAIKLAAEANERTRTTPRLKALAARWLAR